MIMEVITIVDSWLIKILNNCGNYNNHDASFKIVYEMWMGPRFVSAVHIHYLFSFWEFCMAFAI